jgi:hypothetical protein
LSPSGESNEGRRGISWERARAGTEGRHVCCGWLRGWHSLEGDALGAWTGRTRQAVGPSPHGADGGRDEWGGRWEAETETEAEGGRRAAMGEMEMGVDRKSCGAGQSWGGGGGRCAFGWSGPPHSFSVSSAPNFWTTTYNHIKPLPCHAHNVVAREAVGRRQ